MGITSFINCDRTYTFQDYHGSRFSQATNLVLLQTNNSSLLQLIHIGLLLGSTAPAAEETSLLCTATKNLESSATCFLIAVVGLMAMVVYFGLEESGWEIRRCFNGPMAVNSITLHGARVSPLMVGLEPVFVRGKCNSTIVIVNQLISRMSV